jgi:hypothetical protein
MLRKKYYSLAYQIKKERLKSKKIKMDENAKHIILMHLHWIKKGFTKQEIRKIHSLACSEDPFQNVTMKKLQKEMGGQIEYKDTLLSSDFEKITFLYLNYSEYVLDLSFLKYCVNLEEIKFGQQKLKNLDILKNLENIRIIDASSNEIENIDILYAFKNLEKLNLEYNPILSLKPLAHLNKLKSIVIDEIRDEKWVFQILKNNKICSIGYIIKGDILDYENFIFPKYHIGLSMKEDSISIFLTGMNDNYKYCYSEEDPIDFPEKLVSQPDFYERYLTKIKQQTAERLEIILDDKIQVNDSQVYYSREKYSFDYTHFLG